MGYRKCVPHARSPVPDDALLAAIGARIAELRPAGSGVPHRALLALSSLVPDDVRLTVDFRHVSTLGGPLVVVHPRAPRAAEVLAALTPREREVAILVADGARNREVSERLGISLATVKDHVHHALDKLGCESRTELAKLVLAST